MADVHLASPEQVRKDVDNLLGDLFQRRITQAGKLHTRYRRMWEVMYRVYQAGGKRHRPYETVLTYQALGGSDYQKILPVAAATEMLHASLLAIDDVIDRDYMRHGQANISGLYQQDYEPVLHDQVDRVHYADSAAILAENLLLSASHLLLASAPLTEAERGCVLEIFGDAIFIVAGGELLDVEAPFVAKADRADWRTIAQHKTADYSFITPMLLGATLAGASSTVLAVVRAVGDNVGIAYQLSDDMLGMFSTEQETGKPEFSDLEEGKLTYLMGRTLALANPSDARWLRKLLGTRPISKEDGERVRMIMESSGAREDTEALIASYVARAKEHVEQLRLNKAAAEAIFSLIDHAAWRRS